MVTLEQWLKNNTTGEMMLVKTIRREKRQAEFLVKHGKGWRVKQSAKESHAAESTGPKVSKSGKVKEEEPVVETTVETTENDNAATDAFTGVTDMTMDKAKSFIKKEKDVEKLEFIVNNDGRKKVVDAAKARIKELK